MTDPTYTCPNCQYDLLLLTAEALLPEPDRRKKKLSRTLTAGKKLIESLHSRNPEIFNSKASAKRAFNAVGTTIFDALSSGDGVRWSGLGSFKIRQRKPRKGRNPQTGEELQIPARKVITFSPSKALKQKLNA
jgi:DNA-binding protein HU-beta